MANYVFYHNPRCSKSRQALAFLQQTNVSVDIKEYLKVPLTEKEILNLLEALDISNAMNIVRMKEQEFVEAGLTEASTNKDIIAAIVKYPKLLERPILTDGKKAAIGRPLENIQILLSKH